MKAQPLVVYIPDRRDVEISSRYTAGNNKIGYEVFTYSRLAGQDGGTCPGSTVECEAICYAKRIGGAVRDIYVTNSETSDVPPIPEACRLLRIHVSGDFDSIDYIASWYRRLRERPDVTAWAYTRSWRVPTLLTALEALRKLPNLQLFASIDPSCDEMPPTGWRRAWIWRDAERNGWPFEYRLANFDGAQWIQGPGASASRNQLVVEDNTSAYVCPEETGHKRDCVSCGYCFEGQKHDVVFLEH